MLTAKEAANMLGLSSDAKTIEIIQQVRLDAYKEGLRKAQQEPLDIIRKESPKYCPADYVPPKEMYLDGLIYKVSSAIMALFDNATIEDLRK